MTLFACQKLQRPRKEDQIVKIVTKSINIFMVFRSVSDDKISHAYGHPGMSEVMEKIFNQYSPHLEELPQDEFFKALADVNPVSYAKSNGFYIFANLTKSIY